MFRAWGFRVGFKGLGLENAGTGSFNQALRAQKNVDDAFPEPESLGLLEVQRGGRV